MKLLMWMIILVITCIPRGFQLEKIDNIISPYSISTFYDGKQTEFYIASVSQGGELITTEYFENRPDLGEIQFLKKVNWEISIPANTEVFIPFSACSKDESRSFWVSWMDSGNYNALSVMQANPVKIKLEKDDILIHPAITGLNKKFIQFLWRKNKDKWDLVNLEFNDFPDKKPESKINVLTSEKKLPLFFSVVPVTGSKDQAIAAGWVIDEGDGIYAKVLIHSDKGNIETKSYLIPEISVLEKQRIGLYALSNQNAAITLICKRSGDFYVIIEFLFNLEQNTKNIKTYPVRVEPGSLISCASFYYKDLLEFRSFSCLLDKNAELIYIKPKTGFNQIIRNNIDSNYTFPILTSSGGSYEAFYHDNNTIEFRPLQ